MIIIALINDYKEKLSILTELIIEHGLNLLEKMSSEEEIIPTRAMAEKLFNQHKELRNAFVAVATTGRYKLSWEWIFGVLTAVCYVGGVCMAVLRQKAFVVMMDGRYSFYDFKIACEGELKDIEEIEEVKQGIILHTRERKLFIKCGKNMFIERLKEIVDRWE